MSYLVWMVLAHTFNPSAQEAKAGRSLNSMSGLQKELQDSQGYTEKPYLEKQTKDQSELIVLKCDI